MIEKYREIETAKKKYTALRVKKKNNNRHPIHEIEKKRVECIGIKPEDIW